MIDDSGTALEMTAAYDSYRLGRGSGDYLYLLYLLDDPVQGPSDIIPVYIGETSNIASRLMNHFRKVRDALPISEWEDDGSWGSYGKYDHIATVYERADSPLYAWLVDVSEVETGPYGYPTYRQELEAKTVGLVHSNRQFNRVFANRDFVPNRVPHEMGKVGPEWVDLENETPNEEARTAAGNTGHDLNGKHKANLWHNWVEQTIHKEIHDPEEADPIPLFETDENLVVELTDVGSSTVLKRSDAIDTRIREEGKRCVHSNGVKDGPNGLLYVMYQLTSDNPSPAEIIPRYIGKAEAYGKKNELSANFKEIAKNRTGTRSFARWGDGSYWHVGELSDTVFGEDSKKRSWASELFKQGTHQLKEQTYLWIRAWDPEKYTGPYGYPAYLAEVEGLLIGLAYETYPTQLLNHHEVPEDAPANQQEYQFQPPSE
ncbi:GIY-YIG nuclease family protein [Halorussus aquaticus]|uniref:GIY-YIG nuclease family protein n=1 Tax=Halorussus aquaticus TaxID=2953748 RepID=A0ABD5QAJ5_9EURY|nr:GIY-YIG nuclease family protein [Halorussus aquaticus]